MSGAESHDQESVAVVGLAGRFPGAADVEQFWRNLRDGIESISRFSAEELREAGVGAEVSSRANYVNAKGFLEGLDLFDAAFFGYSPREAEVMDPQQRLFLECAWSALEDAGCDAPSFPGAIGVFAATGMNMYLVLNLLRNAAVVEAVGHHQLRIANRLDNLATRTSYKLNLRGPSVNVQAGCSSSLVAVHLACQSLLAGESDVALAGGVRVNSFRRSGYEYQDGSILSPDGRCRAFDERAQGTVGGDGLGVVVLKRLADAVANGDAVRAVIRGSAINNDGAEKLGYTAPSVDGQARVIAEALAVAGVAADSIGYIEAHGTGTPLGDPIEIAGLSQAFRAAQGRPGSCAIGSVKTNIGHLDVASGIAGLIKTVLALERRQIPPSLHFERPNPKLDLEASPFRVNARLAEWRRDAGAPRRAGVSSFGIGGTNAHVVLEEAPAPAAAEEGGRGLHLLVLSARTAAALEARTADLAAFLRREPGCEMADVEATLQRGRSRFEYRRTLVCGDAADAAAALAALDPARVWTAAEEPRARAVAFLFPGQGAQHVGMARSLWEHEPVFRAELDRCADLLVPHLGLDLRDVLYPASGQVEEAARRLAGTDLAQPVLFAVEYALARLWMSWGVRPRALAGHSIGEYVAACLAGVFSLEAGLALVAGRGRLMARMEPGTMLAVPLAADDLRPLLAGGVELAAVNGPEMTVASGPAPEVDALRERLAARGLEARPLHTAHAFHSAAVEPLLDELEALFRDVALAPPSLPYLSNLTGTWITAAEATSARYWTEHLRRTVRFGDNLAELAREPERVLLEVGPGRTLSSLAARGAAANGRAPAIASLPHPRDGEAGLAAPLAALGRLWAAGVEVDWDGFHGGRRRRRVPLPTYPFEGRRFWVDPDATAAGEGARAGLQKRADVREWFYSPSWRRLPPAAAPGDGASGWSVGGERRRWLLLTPGEGKGGEVGTILAARLKAAGQEVIVAEPGERFSPAGDGSWQLDPADPAAPSRLLEATGRPPDRVVHLWCLAAPSDCAGGERGEAERCKSLGFDSLVALARALGSAAPVELTVFASGVVEVLGGEAPCAVKAMLLGAAKVIPQELPGLSCRVVDADAGETAERLADQLAAELAAPAAGAAPPVVALRGGRRWRQGWEPVRLARATPEAPRQLRDRGVYLVTGGLGRIGLVLAALLAETVRARLVLTTRGEFPPRAEWQRRAEAETQGDRTAGRIRRLLAVQVQGAEVEVVRADAADAAAMRAAVAAARHRFGALHGVVHGAGTTGSFHALAEATAATDGLHFAPKVRGTLALRAALAGERPDWVVLLSSLSTVLGGHGYAAHAAAHHFVDAFAQRQSLAGPYPWIAVDLDGWSFGAPARGRGAGSLAAQLAMTPEEGAAALRRLFDLDPLTPVLVSTADLEARVARGLAAPAPEPAAAAAAHHPRPALHGAYVEPRSDSERLIAGIWQGLLGVDRVGAHDDFFELGGHSLLGVQLVSRLRETFAVELPVRRVFEETTVAGLAAVVERALIAEIEALSEEQAQALLEDAPAAGPEAPAC